MFGKCNPTPILLQNRIEQDWKDSFISQVDNSIPIVKVSYPNYYEESNYINTEHYSVLYNNKQVYNNKLKINYSIINGIDFITWINLDRSNTRRLHMEDLLSNIPISNVRISAVDGMNNSIRKSGKFNNFNLEL